MKFKEKLYCNNKIDFFYNQKLLEYKVIAVDDISKNEIIEESAVMPDTTGNFEFKFKTFPWPKGAENPICNVFVQGFGSFIKRTDNIDDANVDWKCNFENNIIIFSTIKDIKQGEDLILFDSETVDFESFEENKDRVKRLHSVKMNIRNLLNNIRKN